MDGVLELDTLLNKKINYLKNKYLYNYCNCDCQSNCECNMICNCNVQIQFLNKEILIKNWFK